MLLWLLWRAPPPCSALLSSSNTTISWEQFEIIRASFKKKKKSKKYLIDQLPGDANIWFAVWKDFGEFIWHYFVLLPYKDSLDYMNMNTIELDVPIGNLWAQSDQRIPIWPMRRIKSTQGIWHQLGMVTSKARALIEVVSFFSKP